MKSSSFPLPNTPAFEALSAEERAWVELVLPWYKQGVTAIAPQRAFSHPLMDEFRRNPAVHLPMMLRFFRNNPVLFDMTLTELTGKKASGKTPAAVEKCWASSVGDFLKQTQAAE